MNKKPVNKNNPKNVKCEHCKYFDDVGLCRKKEVAKNYWNRCKEFEWHSKYNYEREV